MCTVGLKGLSGEMMADIAYTEHISQIDNNRNKEMSTSATDIPSRIFCLCSRAFGPTSTKSSQMASTTYTPSAREVSCEKEAALSTCKTDEHGANVDRL